MADQPQRIDSEIIDALFKDRTDWYTELGTGSTILDPGDTALVITETDNLQLFLPYGRDPTARGAALVEMFFRMQVLERENVQEAARVTNDLLQHLMVRYSRMVENDG